MKILHVTKKYPDALGGDAVVVAHLQKQQQAAGHDVIIVTSNSDEIKNGEHIYKFGLKDTPSNLDSITARRVISLVMLFFRMFSVLYKERPEVIHTHSVDMAFFVSFAARWYHIPMIHTFHIVTFYDKAQSALRRKSELWLAKKARLRRVTAPNTHDVKKLQAAGLRQAALLPNGVDLPFWEPHGYTEKNKKMTFAAIGRLEAQKGYEYLIKAAAFLATTYPLQVIIVGEGSQKATLQKLIQTLHIEDVVTLAGRKDPEEIRSLLAEVHGVVLSSLYETTPLTLLEAWAAEMPTISTPVGILHDAPAGSTASLVVPKRNAHALAQAMRQYAENEPLREEMALAGRREAEKYAWPTVAQTLDTMYRGMQ
jgi:glycosyltransferase involved in cell wall biosynthesis